jgi:hypothetical protein
MASILKVDTIQDQSGNNIINENADTITIGASGDTITIPTGASLTVPNGGLTGQNYPAFRVSLSSATQVTHSVLTTVPFDTTVFDTDSAFDTTTNYDFTVPSGKAGKYFFTFTATCDDDVETWQRALIYISTGGTNYIISDINQDHTQNVTFSGSQIFDLSDGATVTARVDLRTSFGSTPEINGANQTFFSGFRIGD